MPPKLPLAPLWKKRLPVAWKSSYVCPSCALKQISSSKQRPPQRVRYASTLASSTAVNATRDILPSFEALYKALDRLKKDAPNYVNLSRLGLALRGLESKDPVIRIAILGLGNISSARRIARLLLADPLSDEESWERQLDEAAEDDTKGLLLRYGNESDNPTTNPLVTTLHIPSRILHLHNIEVLVSAINVGSGALPSPGQPDQLKNVALIPTAETPKSFSGSVSFITYPVHRSLILAEGVDGCLALGRYAADQMQEDGGPDSTFKVAVALPSARAASSGDTQVAAVTVLNVSTGVEALRLFRESKENATPFEEGWFRSGMPALTEWFSGGSGPPGGMKPALKNLVESLLDDTSRNILAEEELLVKELNSARSSMIERQPLDESLKVWAIRAHNELRDQLETAFGSSTWAKLKWWKLLFRVDDVSMIMSEVLDRNWLVNAEKEVIWLAGRGTEAGIYDDTGAFLSPPESSTAFDSEEHNNVPESQQLASQSPWPSQLLAARNTLKATTVPPMQAIAQSLVVQSLTVTALSAGLSGLLYVALPAASLFETASIAALGFAWSMRRVQKIWETSRSNWESDLRETGRLALRGTEESIRAAIRQAPRSETSTYGTEDRKAARVAVEEAQNALIEADSKK